MRLKGRYISDRKIQPIYIPTNTIQEIDCGMGRTRLKTEIEAFTMMPKHEEPKCPRKNSVIIASIVIALIVGTVSLIVSPYMHALGALSIICFAWISFVLFANRRPLNKRDRCGRVKVKTYKV